MTAAHGGWRGAGRRIWTATGACAQRLEPRGCAGVPRPPRHAAGLAARPWCSRARRDEAKLGWIDRPAGRPARRRHVPRSRRSRLADLGWARPVQSTAPASPRRMADVVQRRRRGDGRELVQPAPRRPRRAAAQPPPRDRPRAAAPDPARCRARWSRWTRAPAACWRCPAAGASRRASSTARPRRERQPGQLVQADGLSDGAWSTASRRASASSTRRSAGQDAQGVWRPNNFEMTFGGPTPLHDRAGEVAQPGHRAAGREGRHGRGGAERDRLPRGRRDAARCCPPRSARWRPRCCAQAGGLCRRSRWAAREVLPTLVDSVQDRDGHVIWRPPASACQRLQRPGAAADAGRQPQADRRPAERLPARAR